MKPSNELFELIRSLTQNEKRYFKVSSAQLLSKDSNYLRLFDAIEAQSEYDEIAIKSQFKNEPFIKQLHVAKNYLYNNLLKSLTAYHASTSMIAPPVEMIKCLEILYEKGFYKQCEKLMQAVIKYCKKHDLSIQLLAFFEWDLKLKLRQNRFRDIEKLMNEQKSVLNEIQDTIKYKEITTNIIEILWNAGPIVNSGQILQIEKILAHEVFAKNDAQLSVESKYYKYSALSLYAKAKNDDKLIANYSKILLTVIDNRSENPFRVIAIFTNLCAVLINQKDFKEAANYIKKLRNFSEELDRSKWESASRSGILASYNIELALHISTADFDQMPVVVSKLEHLTKAGFMLSQNTRWWDLKFNVAYSMFLCGCFDISLKWALDILSEPKGNVVEGIYIHTQVLFLLIHYELGNYAFLKNVIKNTLSQLDKKNMESSPARILVFLLIELVKTSSKEKRHEILTQFYADLNNKAESNVTDSEFIDIQAWFESRIQETDIRTVIIRRKNILLN